VLLYFRQDWARLAAGSWRDLRARALRSSVEARLLLLLMLATIPAAVAGLLLEAPFERILAADAVALARSTAALLLVTGAILLAAEHVGSRDRPAERLSLGGALVVGFAQAAAILPGLSRSGATIAAGLWAGLTRPEAARFSFLLAAPIIVGAGLVELGDASAGTLQPSERAALVAGFLAAFVTGYVAISWLLRFLRRAPLTWFVAYTWILGATALWLLR
jgi:undecaprenyl-diphosphatase